MDISVDQSLLHRRILVDSNKGTIRYIGPVLTSKNPKTIWLGIEWDDENRGKHDGCVQKEIDGQLQTRRYFHCGHNCGSFIKPSKTKLSYGRCLRTVILDRYSMKDLAEDMKEQQTIAKDSGYKIEFVGWDKSIARQCDLSNKASVGLDVNDCSYVDISDIKENASENKNSMNLKLNGKMKELQETVPHLQFLDLRRNLISNLSLFAPAFYAFSNTLHDLDLSHNLLNILSLPTIGSLVNTFQCFQNIRILRLNHSICMSSTNVEHNPAIFEPWRFIYLLLINNCLPNIKEFEICGNRISNFKLPISILNNDLDSNPNDFSLKTETPDGKKLALFATQLEIVNVGGNPVYDWGEIASVFGYIPNLKRFRCSYCQIQYTPYISNVFQNLTHLWMRNNLISNVDVFDEWNRFPSLNHILFIESSIEDIYGHNTLRDLAIAKIKKILVCNGSIVNGKERNDSELFYLKWIAKKLKEMKNNSESNSNNISVENENKKSGDFETKIPVTDEEIEEMFPRYIVLHAKHGTVRMKEREESRLFSIQVRIKSMDPASITAEVYEKRLPVTMTVAQLKLLCKRLFHLNVKHQRLMYRDSGGSSFPDDLYDDTRTLSFYNIKDGAEILMQSTDFKRVNKNKVVEDDEEY